MPKGVVKSTKDAKIWAYKKKQVEKQTGKKSSKFTSDEWRRVNFLYQKAKKKYKGKLPKKYTEACFKNAVFASYTVVVASTELDKLHEGLQKARQQIDLLCEGFNVHLDPSYGSIINKVIKNIDIWEKTDKIAEIIDKVPVIYFNYKQSTLSATGADNSRLPPILFKQFHDKFLNIATAVVVPALRAYMKQNPTIKLKMFKPLLNVAIK